MDGLSKTSLVVLSEDAKQVVQLRLSTVTPLQMRHRVVVTKRLSGLNARIVVNTRFKNMKFKYSISLTFLMFLSPTFAFNFLSNNLMMYRCQSEEEAVSCRSCKKFTNSESFDSTNFKIDVKKSNIIREAIKNKSVIKTQLLKNCTVIDKKNWKCVNDVEMSSPENYSRNRQGMSNGQYYGLSEVFVRSTSKDAKEIKVHRYTCAK